MVKRFILYASIALCTFGFVFFETIDTYAVRAVGKIVLGILVPCLVALLNKERVFKTKKRWT